MYGATGTENEEWSRPLGLEVIGAGYGRTGTDSLKVALNDLGFKTYHMYEVTKHGDHEKWIDADTNLHEPGGDKQKGMQYLKNIFNDRGYTATVDFPSSLYYAELFKMNPDAKVVLTVRDAAKWYESCLKTFWHKDSYQFSWIIGLTEKGQMLQRMQRHVTARALGVPLQEMAEVEDRRKLVQDKEHCVRKFNEHIETVKAVIPPKNLLVFRVSEGWEPLCKFLDKPVPSTPFPNVNDKGHFQGDLFKAKVTILVIFGLIYTALGTVLLGGAVGLVMLARLML